MFPKCAKRLERQKAPVSVNPQPSVRHIDDIAVQHLRANRIWLNYMQKQMAAYFVCITAIVAASSTKQLAPRPDRQGRLAWIAS